MPEVESLARFLTERCVGHVIARIDLAYPDRLLAIEADGYRYHSGRHAWQRDLIRQTELTSRGWRVLRFSWEDVHRRPEWVVEEVVRSYAA